MRRLVISVTATVLAMLGLLGMKTAAASKSGNAATVARNGDAMGKSPAGSTSAAGNGMAGSVTTMANDTVVATGPQIALAHGIVQVRATLVSGRITDVTALSLPHDNPHSWSGSNGAAVKLRSEALSKQSADIAIVSGATYTSHGYITSLQAALDAAGQH